MLVEIGCFVPAVLLQCIKEIISSQVLFFHYKIKRLSYFNSHPFLSLILSVRSNARVKDRIIFSNAKYLIAKTNLIVMALLFSSIK